MPRIILRLFVISFMILIVLSYKDIIHYFSSINLSFNSFLADINQSEDLYLTPKEYDISGLNFEYIKDGNFYRIPLDGLVIVRYGKDLVDSPYGTMTPKEINEYLSSVEKSYGHNRPKEFLEWLYAQRRYLSKYSDWFLSAKKEIKNEIRENIKAIVSSRLSERREEALSSIFRNILISFFLSVIVVLPFSRGITKSTPFNMEKASGSWASLHDILRNYLIVTRGVRILISVTFTAFLALVIYVATGIFWLSFSPAPFGFLLYEYINNSKNFFPLGKPLGLPFKIGLKRKDRFMHTLVCAPTGARKTTSVIIPGLLQDSLSDCSAMVIDAKSPELFNTVAGAWISRGKKVILFDPWHPACIGFNPLYKASDEELNTIVSAFMGNPPKVAEDQKFFRGRTEDLLYAMLRLAQTFPEELCNLPTVFLLARNVKDLIHKVELCRDEKIQSFFKDYIILSSDQKVNILSSIREKLQIFRDEAVQAAFSRSDFDLSVLFREKEPALLIVGVPQDKGALGTLIASLMSRLVLLRAFEETRIMKQASPASLHQSENLFSQNIEEIIEPEGESSSGSEEKEEGESPQKNKIEKDVKVLNPPVFKPNDLCLYLDEFPSLNIPDIAEKIRMARYTNTHLIICVQDLSDLETLYTNYRTIIANLRTQIYLRGCEIKTCEYISSRLGKTRTLTKRYPRPLFSVFSISKNRQWEEDLLMSSDSIQNMPDDMAICFTPHTRPFLVRLHSQFTSKNTASMIVPITENLKPYKPNSEPLKAPSIPLMSDFIEDETYREWLIEHKKDKKKYKDDRGVETEANEFYMNEPLKMKRKAQKEK